MNRSVIIAAGILAAFIAFFAYGTLRANGNGEAVAPSDSSQSEALPEAIIVTLGAELHPVMLTLKGQTAPDKSVTVKAATTGKVVATPAREGQYVQQGALLCGLDVEARKARLNEAEASRQSAQIDLNAARALAAKGLSPANRVAAAEAAFDARDAGVSAARIELSKTQIRAPFSGIFETRIAETGDFLSAGAPCGVLVDLSPVIVTVDVAEAWSGKLSNGMAAVATLPSGAEYPAKLRYIARSANPQTRTFLVEAALQTGKAPVAAGITTRLRIKLSETDATLLSPALLTLADDGQVGVRYVDSDNRVRFAGVEVVDDADNGVWVTGLPSPIEIISIGQEYLSEGIEVTPVRASTEP